MEGERAAFWDSSALIPLCVRQTQSPQAVKYSDRFHIMVVWWVAPLEIQSGLARLFRAGEMSLADKTVALKRLDAMRASWHEIVPVEAVKVLAGDLLWNYSLRTADAMQLAAALTWCSKRPQSRPFVCFDDRLGLAAQQVGFEVFCHVSRVRKLH
jgi:predicted nucleic acid-binding protein